jgi:hypothetical protein
MVLPYFFFFNYLSMTIQPLWTLAAFSGYLSYTHSLGLLGRVIRQSLGRYLYTDIHASSGIQIRDFSVCAGEEGLCLRPRGHGDRNLFLTKCDAFSYHSGVK